MPNFLMNVYNFTGKPFSMTLTSESMPENQRNTPTTINNIQTYDSATGTGKFLSFNVAYPYTDFIFNSEELYGKTNFYRLGGADKGYNIADQWNYYVVVGVAPNSFVDSNGKDVSDTVNNYLTAEHCSTTNCGYVFLKKYPKWFTNVVSDPDLVEAGLKNILTIVFVILVVLVVGAIALAGIVWYSKKRKTV